MVSNFIAIDMGASSGRLMLGELQDETLSLKELHRFKTGGISINNRLYWNILRFYEEILGGLRANARKLSKIGLDGIGVDTWGVDFTILDQHDNQVGIPYHYRDPRMLAAYDKLFDYIPKEEIYKVTGVQFMALNTIVQLLALALGDYPASKRGKEFLMLPDYFNFILSGEKKIEYTDASTTQLLNAKTRAWHEPFLQAIGVETAMFSEPLEPCQPIGNLQDSIMEQTGLRCKPTIHLTASHDTASAVVGTPLESSNSAYLSSGTWSLLGMEINEPILTNAAMDMNFTNEGGAGNTIRLLKNIMGLWLIQEVKRGWEITGEHQYDYNQIEQLAKDEGISKSLVFPDDQRFLNPKNMISEIRDACNESGQDVPKTLGQIATTVFTSLALRYRETVEDLETLTGQKVDCVHVVGGGAKNALLCQYTADATNLPVHAGPSEATSIGNVISQAISSRIIKDIAEGRNIVKKSFPPVIYQPENPEEWDELYVNTYMELLGESGR